MQTLSRFLTTLAMLASAATLSGAEMPSHPDGASSALADPLKASRGLSGSDWSGIRQAYEHNRHAIVANADGTYQARNPGQAWMIRFDGRGFTVTPDVGGWSWGLELIDCGTVAQVRQDGGTVSYLREDGLTEWFVNDTRGLEQGWTLAKRPGHAEVTGSFRLNLMVRGGLRPQVSPEAGSVAFLNESGGAALIYDGLKAWDADGEAVQVRFAQCEAGDAMLCVMVDDALAHYPITVDPLASQAYLKASNTEANDEFGSCVAVSGDTVVVGARSEASGSTGVNGNQADNSAMSSGAAYVFVRSGTTWSQQAYLKASNTGASDGFGSSVAVSGDSVVVGASGESSSATGVNGNQADNSASYSGAAYVFVRSGTTWSQQAYLKASNTGASDAFGYSLAMFGDTISIGSPFEDSSAIGVNGNQTNNSAGNSGSAYVFVRSGTTWSQQAYIKSSNTGASDGFGYSVAMSDETVVIGASLEASSATGVNGNQADNSARDSGAAYVFARSGATWSQQAYLKASNTEAYDYFGYSVAVSGETVVVGASSESSSATGVNGNQTNNSAYSSGAAYVFARSGTIWSQQAYLKASKTGIYDRFGTAVAVSGDSVVVGTLGSWGASSEGSSDTVHVFGRNGTTWSQQRYFKGSKGMGFGSSVAVSGETLIVGAPNESSGATGVNGNPADTTARAAGAAFVFANVVRPANDDFANRAGLGSGTTASVAGTLAGASGESLALEPDLKDQVVSPPALGGYNNDATVWYQWTAPAGSQWASVKVAGPPVATVLSVYTGETLAGLANIVLSRRDLPDVPNRVAFQATPGRTYQIRVAVWWEDYHLEPRLAFNLELSAVGNPATVADFIARGRGWLQMGTSTVLGQAAADFSSALAIDPANGEARFLRALTNLLLLQTEPAFNQALSDLGASRVDGDAPITFPEDPDGDPIVKPGARSGIVIDWVTGQLLPRLATVLSDLAAVTSNDFRTDLSAAETGGLDTLVDKGDVLVLKAVSHGLEMLFQLLFTYNLDVPFDAMVTLDKAGQLDAQHVLASSSALLKFAASDRRPQFAAALRAMQLDYASASDFIRNQRADPAYLLTEGLSTDPEREVEIRDGLASAVASLNGEITYQGTRVNLSRLIATNMALRDWLPEIREGKALPATLPDPTLNGILPAMSGTEIDNRIYQMGILWGMSQYAAEFGNSIEMITGKGDPSEDADGDGRDNFAEWLAHSNPFINDTVWQELTRNVITPGKNEVRLTFVRRKDLRDWKLRVAVSDDMETWDRTETQIERVGIPVDNGDGLTETVTYRLKDSAALASKKFLRVEAAPK